MKAIAPEKHRNSIGILSSFDTAVIGFYLTTADRAVAPTSVIDVLMKLISHTVTFSSFNCTSLSMAYIEQYKMQAIWATRNTDATDKFEEEFSFCSLAFSGID